MLPWPLGFGLKHVTNLAVTRPIEAIKNGGVTITKTDVFINQFTTYFGPERPLSGDS
jgi:hypothetical protein